MHTQLMYQATSGGTMYTYVGGQLERTGPTCYFLIWMSGYFLIWMYTSHCYVGVTGSRQCSHGKRVLRKVKVADGLDR
jgi:hypothetical protein